MHRLDTSRESSASSLIHLAHVDGSVVPANQNQLNSLEILTTGSQCRFLLDAGHFISIPIELYQLGRIFIFIFSLAMLRRIITVFIVIIYFYVLFTAITAPRSPRALITTGYFSYTPSDTVSTAWRADIHASVVVLDYIILLVIIFFQIFLR